VVQKLIDSSQVINVLHIKRIKISLAKCQHRERIKSEMRREERNYSAYIFILKKILVPPQTFRVSNGFILFVVRLKPSRGTRFVSISFSITFQSAPAN